MEKYLIPLVPGPVAVPQEILKVAAMNFGSADFEPEYLALYKDTEKLLQKMMETRNRVVIQTGEGMLVLWTALKSTLKPGDRVLVPGCLARDSVIWPRRWAARFGCWILAMMKRSMILMSWRKRSWSSNPK